MDSVQPGIGIAGEREGTELLDLAHANAAVTEMAVRFREQRVHRRVVQIGVEFIGHLEFQDSERIAATRQLPDSAAIAPDHVLARRR